MAPTFPQIRPPVHPDDGAYCPVCLAPSLRAHPTLPVSMCTNDQCASTSASFRHETFDEPLHGDFIRYFDKAPNKEAFLDAVPEHNAAFNGWDVFYVERTA